MRNWKGKKMQSEENGTLRRIQTDKQSGTNARLDLKMASAMRSGTILSHCVPTKVNYPQRETSDRAGGRASEWIRLVSKITAMVTCNTVESHHLRTNTHTSLQKLDLLIELESSVCAFGIADAECGLMLLIRIIYCFCWWCAQSPFPPPPPHNNSAAESQPNCHARIRFVYIFD